MEHVAGDSICSLMCEVKAWKNVAVKMVNLI